MISPWPAYLWTVLLLTFGLSKRAERQVFLNLCGLFLTLSIFHTILQVYCWQHYSLNDNQNYGLCFGISIQLNSTFTIRQLNTIIYNRLFTSVSYTEYQILNEVVLCQ